MNVISRTYLVATSEVVIAGKHAQRRGRCLPMSESEHSQSAERVHKYMHASSTCGTSESQSDIQHTELAPKPANTEYGYAYGIRCQAQNTDTEYGYGMQSQAQNMDTDMEYGYGMCRNQNGPQEWVCKCRRELKNTEAPNTYRKL